MVKILYAQNFDPASISFACGIGNSFLSWGIFLYWVVEEGICFALGNHLALNLYKKASFR